MKEKILERFLRYVQVNTASCEANEGTPSTKCQFDLARMLEKELKEIGVSDVYVDEHCYVYGCIPATEGKEDVPKIGFIAHMDTVSDFCDKQVVPVIHENYDGKDIFLPEGNRTIAVRDYPHLANMKGRTLITSDGTTILGADDKDGVAEIVTMAEELIKSGIPHGKVCIGFTPDEEIGSGAELMDLERFGADYAFTVDGELEGEIEYETFNAASAVVTISGVSVHPGCAKDIMINAAVVGSEFQGMLPEKEQPRTTSGYEGFFHLISFNGNVDNAVLKYIIRDHDRDIFEQRKQKMEEIAQTLNQKYGEGTVSLEIRDTYYNMAEILKDHMHLIETAEKAAEDIGLQPDTKPVRGGTDGSRLSFRGLPCPNLGSGGFAFHGPFEHSSLEGMEMVVRHLLKIVERYAG